MKTALFPLVTCGIVSLALVCSSASDLVCRERGQLGGYGPVEWNPTSVSIVCF